MLDRLAIRRFHERQRATLRRAYEDGWRAGVANYQPDPNAPSGEPLPASRASRKGVGLGAAMLLARRATRYVAPSEPERMLRARAMAPALGSLGRMTQELAALTPSPAHLAEARSAAASGAIGEQAQLAYASALALTEYLDSNAYRLDGGDSVAWSGEQNGYGEAAAAAGALLSWTTEGDDAVCPTCEDMGNLPPMPLADWPTTPGTGDSECSVGCRCSLDAEDPADSPDGPPVLSQTDQEIIGRVSDKVSAGFDAAALESIAQSLD